MLDWRAGALLVDRGGGGDDDPALIAPLSAAPIFMAADIRIVQPEQ